MKILSCLLLCLTLFGCSNNITRGSIIYDSQLKLLSKNMTKDQVIKIVGPPAIISHYTDNEIWYYIGRYMKQSSVGRPILLSQKLLVLNFDEIESSSTFNLLKNFKFKEVHNLPQIGVVSQETTVEGSNESVIDHFIKNLGRFQNKHQVKKR